MNINRSIINKEALNKILNNPLQRQFEQFRSETEPFHKPFQDGCNRLLDESNWITEVAHYLKERNEATPILFLKAGWPPPLDFPASQLDKLMDDFLNILENETGHKDKFIKEMSKVFIDFYDNERIDEIEDRWSKNPFLSNRMCILKEGLLNYREKRFTSCVAIILPHIEGLVVERLLEVLDEEDDKEELKKIRKGNIKPFINDFFAFMEDGISREFYENILWSGFVWGDEKEDVLSRHRIFHGNNVDYGTAENALKIILIFDAFQKAIFDKNNG